jgi:predicted ATPase
MEGKRFIRTLAIGQLLSYNSNIHISKLVPEALEFQPLNVIIGANASGKSNLIEVIGLLQACPTNLLRAINQGGGVKEWLWKDAKENSHASIIATFTSPNLDKYPRGYLAYSLWFKSANGNGHLQITKEGISETLAKSETEFNHHYFYSYLGDSRPKIEVKIDNERRKIETDVRLDLSVLSQKQDSEIYPELTYLAEQFKSIKIYRRWNFEPERPPRSPQPISYPEDFLAEDGSNLAGVINSFMDKPKIRKVIENQLKQLHPRAERLSIKKYDSAIQLFLDEAGDRSISAARLSEGTLRYLSLLSILCHPNPPSLICIEEPELGLHPDLLPNFAKLLIEAATRTQLIITTHSELLLSALSEVPECVVVCEYTENGTKLSRPDPEKLKEWMKDGTTLGELWLSGKLGGTRW